MANGGNKPKPAFYVAVAVVVVGLLGLALWRCSAKKGSSGGGKTGSGDKIDINDIKKQAGGDKAGQAEQEGGATGLTADHFEEVQAQALPEVKETSDYQKLGAKRVVRMAINVWAGWAPIIWANEGKGPKKVWKDAKGNDFQLELVLIDDPAAMAEQFAQGKIHLGWATVDMLPLLVQRLNRDERTMPRVFEQIDWSNGGDGIVVRDDIKNVGDLRDKKVALAQQSPSEYFLLNMLLNGGVQPGEVQMKFYGDAFQAAQAFNSDKSISACVSWSPDIYTLASAKGNKMLINTLTANKLIADVWFARADFARDNMDILESLVRGFLDATDQLSKADDATKQKVGALMDDIYSLPPGTGVSMLPDAHWTNYAENKEFLLNANNPANFSRTYNTAFLLYKAIGVVKEKVPAENIADPSIIKKLESDPKYKDSKDEYKFNFTPVAGADINVESAVLTKRVVIQFYPNSYDINKKVPGQNGGPDALYDPNVTNTLDSIAQLAAQYGAARIEIEGHTDSSMKQYGASEDLVRELSLNRANSVKEALVNKYNLDPNQFHVTGWGWDKPADPGDPDNNAKNRRVEVKVIPAEAQ